MIENPFEKLQECHDHILEQLAKLEVALHDLEAGGISALIRQKECLTKTFEFIDTSGHMHTKDEEEGLFPFLDSKLQPRVQRLHFDRTPVQAIKEQHRKGEEITERLRFLNDKLQKDPNQMGAEILLEEFVRKSQALIEFYREHIRGENEVVFPLAERLLTQEEKAEVARIMDAHRRSSES